MKKVFQTITGIGGNCFAACIASILELGIEDAPNFCGDPDDDKYLGKTDAWLQERGWRMAEIELPRNPKRQLVVMSKNTSFIVSGPGARGLMHSCVAMIGDDGIDIIHDPYRGGEGVKPIESMTLIFPRPRPVGNVDVEA